MAAAVYGENLAVSLLELIQYQASGALSGMRIGCSEDVVILYEELHRVKEINPDGATPWIATYGGSRKLTGIASPPFHRYARGCVDVTNHFGFFDINLTDCRMAA